MVQDIEQLHFTDEYVGVPEHLRESLVAYVTMHRMTGGFLEAVLANDLSGACARADKNSRVALYDIVFWLFNQAPVGCWGSQAKYNAWIKVNE